MAATAEDLRIEPTRFQASVLAIPEQYDLVLAGGRGGGKTFALLLLILRHVETYGRDARVLVVRKNFPDLRDFEAEARYLFGTAYGTALRYNSQQHLFTFPNGATVALDQYESQADFPKFQGKSYSLIAVEEAGQYPDPAPLDMLRSSLRSKADVPCRMVLSANPGGSGHGWINQRHVAGIAPWKPHDDPKSGRTFVTAPSTLTDNPHLGADYADQITAATASDEELRKAWLHGDWAIARGAFFGQVFDTQRNVIDAWPSLPGTSAADGLTRLQEKWRLQNAEELGKRPNLGWEYYVAGDHGSAAPACFYLIAKSPGALGPDGHYYARDSLILFDEVAHVERDTLNSGMGLTVPTMADDIVQRCESWGMTPEGVLDDACFAYHGNQSGTLADEYRRAGFRAQPAKKGDRLSGWQIMRRLMADAGKPDKPGLYISERCTYWLQTVPFLDRDPRRPEDLDTKQADHAADATRYGCLFERPHIQVSKLKGY